MHLLFKTLYLPCTCSYQLKLHEDCVHHTIVYSFTVIYLTLFKIVKIMCFKLLMQKYLNYPSRYINENQFQLNNNNKTEKVKRKLRPPVGLEHNVNKLDLRQNPKSYKSK